MAGQDVVNPLGLVYTPQGSGTNVNARSDNFGNTGVNEVFGRYTELCRNGNLYLASSLNTSDAGIAGVVALPTTTSGRLVYNAAPAGSNIYVIPLIVGVAIKSGTQGSGLSVIAGIPAGNLATPLTASGSNMVCKNMLDGVTNDPTTFTDINKTVVQTTYMHLSNGGAAVGIGSGFTFDVGGMWIIQPQKSFEVSVLAPTGTSPVFFVSVVYAKIKFDAGTPQ